MTNAPSRDVVLVGGGIVGLATAFALRDLDVTLVEAEGSLGAHQTSHNSGVLHAGLYHRPGSKKARHCREGREKLQRFCAQHGVPFEICGKLVVAAVPSEVPALDTLEERGRANGVLGLRRLSPEEAREREPNVRCASALLVPETGIIDFARVAKALAEATSERGAEIRRSTVFQRAVSDGDELRVITTQGDIRCRVLVACAGLQSDRVARACGLRPNLRIVPFRGEYQELVPSRRDLVRHLIYPVPDPRLPFLGVHFTRTLLGRVEVGPNAVLALSRTGYRRGRFSLRDAWSTLSYPGFWHLAARFPTTGVSECWRSLSKRALVRSLRHLVPAIEQKDLVRGGAGVRAQALSPQGILLDDFEFLETDRMVHVLNAPSPAATASLSLGEDIAARVRARLEARHLP